MKNVKLIIVSSLLLMAVLAGCSSQTSIEKLNEIKKPATVFSAHQDKAWYESPTMSIKDADGQIIGLPCDNELRGLIDKYKVGDTIR